MLGRGRVNFETQENIFPQNKPNVFAQIFTKSGVLNHDFNQNIRIQSCILIESYQISVKILVKYMKV